MDSLISAGNWFSFRLTVIRYAYQIDQKFSKPSKVQELDESKLKSAFIKLKNLPKNENLFSFLVELR